MSDYYITFKAAAGVEREKIRILMSNLANKFDDASVKSYAHNSPGQNALNDWDTIFKTDLLPEKVVEVIREEIQGVLGQGSEVSKPTPDTDGYINITYTFI